MKMTVTTFNKADWLSFSKSRDQVLPHDISDIDIDQLTNNISETILRMAESCIPVNRMNRRSNLVPWWNEEYRNEVGVRKRALKTFHRHSILKLKAS